MKKVIVIGTGIIGAVASYELARRGHEVLMVDSNEKGQSTQAAAGMINPWVTKRRSKSWYKLATKGAAFLPSLIKNLEADGEQQTGYKQIGSIHLHTDDEQLIDLYNTTLKRKELTPEIGEVTLLDENKVHQSLPFLKEGYIGMHISGASRIDGRTFTKALCQAAEKYGATRLDGRATFATLQHQVIGIKINDTIIEADEIVVTNGVWMPQLLETIGANLQIIIQKGELLHINADVSTAHMPGIVTPNNLYILPYENNRIVIGATFHRIRGINLNASLSVEGMYEMLEKTTMVAPGLKQADIIQSRVGFRPYTGSFLPTFGSLPYFNNVHIANGLGASGLSTGPIIGNQLAKIISGEKLDMEHTPYMPQNFITP